MNLQPPQNRDARPDGVLLLALLRKAGVDYAVTSPAVNHLEALWEAEKFDPDWMAKVGVEALPSKITDGTEPLTLNAEDFKRLCQSVHQFERVGISVGSFKIQVVNPQQWSLEGFESQEALLKELGFQ